MFERGADTRRSAFIALSSFAGHSFARFLVVGTVGYLVDASLLKLLILGGTGPLFGRACSIAVAMLFTWTLHRSWTFANRRQTAISVELTSFATAQGAGLTLNYGLFALLVTLWPALAHHPYAAVATSSVFVLGFNYLALRHWVYRRHQDA